MSPRLHRAAACMAVLLAPMAAPSAAAAQEVVDKASASAAVDNITFRFAPPLGQPMRLRIEREQLASDGTLFNFTATYIVRFDAAGRGFQLTSRLTDLQSNAPVTLSAAFGGMLAPLQGVDVRYLIAADGSSLDLADGDALWAQLRLADAANAKRSSRDEARSLLGNLLELSPAQRENMLASDIDRLLAFAGRTVESDPQIATVPGSDGQRTLARDGKLILIVEDSSTAISDGRGSSFDTHIDWQVDEASGLLVREARETRMRDGQTGTTSLQARTLRTLEPVADAAE